MYKTCKDLKVGQSLPDPFRRKSHRHEKMNKKQEMNKMAKESKNQKKKKNQHAKFFFEKTKKIKDSKVNFFNHKTNFLISAFSCAAR